MEEKTDDELVDVEVWEFSLDSEEIDELIGKLKDLREKKESVSFDVDEDNELLIHYEENEDEDGEDDGKEGS